MKESKGERKGRCLHKYKEVEISFKKDYIWYSTQCYVHFF